MQMRNRRNEMSRSHSLDARGRRRSLAISTRGIMKTNSAQRLRSRVVKTTLAFAVAVTLINLAGLASSAPSASATEIICRISPGLQGPAADQGISCGGGSDGSGSGYTSGSRASSACHYGFNTDQLPDGFLKFTAFPYVDYVDD